MTLTVQGQECSYRYYIHSCRPNFNHSMMGCFRVTVNVGKAHQMSPKRPYLIHGQIYPYGYYIHPKAQILSISHDDEPFLSCWSYSNFMTLHPVNTKIASTCARSQVPICILHRLLHTNVGKSATNDPETTLTCSRSMGEYAYYLPPGAQIFVPLALHTQSF